MTGTRKEWLAARLELLEAEKETDLGAATSWRARRQESLLWVPIDKDYRFETDEGSASLAEPSLRGRSQLLVYHFMFGPDYTAGCPACSAIADGFNGFVVHLANHDVMLGAVSLAPLVKLYRHTSGDGWTFPWASSLSSATSTLTSNVLDHRGATARGGGCRIQLPARRPHALDTTPVEAPGAEPTGNRKHAQVRGHDRNRRAHVYAPRGRA